MILGSPPANFKWELFPWSLGQCNLARTAVFSFWFKESLMDFWCAFDALLMRFLAALHKPYRRLHPVNFTWNWLHALFLKFDQKKLLSKQTSYKISMHFCIFDALLMHFWCTFGALLMHFWCTFDALLMHFWCTFDALFKSASKCIKNASKVHQKCIKSASSLKVHQKCIKSASTVHQKCITNFDIVHLNFFKI